MLGMLGVGTAAAAGLGLLEASAAAGLGLGQKDRSRTTPRSVADSVDGTFRLRAVSTETDPGPEGTYLTANGLGEPVTVGPEVADGQKWRLVAVEGKQDFYVISPAADASLPLPSGLAREESENDDKVVLSSNPDQWRLAYVPIDMPGGDVSTIHGREFIGAEVLLATGDSSNVVVKAFAVSADKGNRPAWQLLPVSL